MTRPRIKLLECTSHPTSENVIVTTRRTKNYKNIAPSEEDSEDGSVFPAKFSRLSSARLANLVVLSNPSRAEALTGIFSGLPSTEPDSDWQHKGSFRSNAFGPRKTEAGARRHGGGDGFWAKRRETWPAVSLTNKVVRGASGERAWRRVSRRRILFVEHVFCYG
jgi:hypothetical protein